MNDFWSQLAIYLPHSTEPFDSAFLSWHWVTEHNKNGSAVKLQLKPFICVPRWSWSIHINSGSMARTLCVINFAFLEHGKASMQKTLKILVQTFFGTVKMLKSAFSRSKLIIWFNGEPSSARCLYWFRMKVVSFCFEKLFKSKIKTI